MYEYLKSAAERASGAGRRRGVSKTAGSMTRQRGVRAGTVRADANLKDRRDIYAHTGADFLGGMRRFAS